MSVQVLGWAIFFTLVFLVYAIPYTIAQFDLFGGRFFTFLGSKAGALVVTGGTKERVTYRKPETNGTDLVGEVITGWTFLDIIVPLGYGLEWDDSLDTHKIVRAPFEWWMAFSFNYHLKLLGVSYVSFLPVARRLTDWFDWAEISDKPESKGRYVERREPTDMFFIVPTQYAIRITEMETADNIQVEATFVLVIQIVAPEITLARREDWFSQLQSFLEGPITTWVRGRFFEQLKTKDEEKEFIKMVIELNKDDLTRVERPQGFLHRLGIQVTDVEIPKGGFELSDKTAQSSIQKAVLAKAIAQREGDANIVTAQKGVQVAELKAKAKSLELEPYAGREQFRKWEMMERAGSAGSAIVFEGEGSSLSTDQKRIITANVAPRRWRMEQPVKEDGGDK